MSNVVNLNRIRKQKTRAQGKRRAEENAVKFGRTKAERIKDETEAARQARHLDGHKKDDT